MLTLKRFSALLALSSLVGVAMFLIGCCSGSSNSNASSDTAANRRFALQNLAGISLGAAIYAQDYDELLPPATNAAAAQALLFPFVRDSSYFTDPINNRAFEWNSWLAGQQISTLPDTSQIVAFWDSDAALASTRPVGLLNGSSKFVTDVEWQALKITSHIP